MKIAIQTGLKTLEELLKNKGYNVVPFRESGLGVKISIVTDIDEAYEEIDPVTFYGPEGDEMVILNATQLSEEDILRYVEKYATKPQTVALQNGLEDIKEKLAAKGYDVVSYGDDAKDVRVTVINSVVGAYEEIDPVSFFGEGDNEMVVLDASKLTAEQIVMYVEKYTA